MSVEYLEAHLEKQSPRLVLNSEIDRKLKHRLKTDPVVQNVYEAFKLNARNIQSQPLLERNVIGRRLLATSREMLYRMNILGMVYHIDKEQEVLSRINDELIAVLNFKDWNPSHFLDVAEMAMAVALAIDWAGDDLPESTVQLAKTALIEKAIMPSYNENGNTGWINGVSNWNQVCHAGMVAASIVIAEEEPELAAKTISRALNGIPHALKEYGPDGAYPEGPTYWDYGTSFSVLTSSILESAFGTDFGIAESPSFMDSAYFILLTTTPSDNYYNFADSGTKRRENGDLTLAWFGVKSGNSLFYEEERFLRDPQEMGKLKRHAGAGLVWLSQFEDNNKDELPIAWKGDGKNPLAIFRNGEDDPMQFYLGGKGGMGAISHGHLDAGSFVFELDNVRWSIDPGSQGYSALEETGFDLWNREQDSDRWTLQAYNNYGHSTLTVNNLLHKADGFASLVSFNDGISGENPEATFDLSDVFDGQLKSAARKFMKEGPRSVVIEDNLEVTELTKLVTWQMVTTAEVEPAKGGAVLKKDGRELSLEILSPTGIDVSVVSLNPAPMPLDKQIEDFKRIEIRVPAWWFKDQKGIIRVRLSGDSL